MFSKVIRVILFVISLSIAATGYSQENPFFEELGGVTNTHYEVLPQAVKQLCKRELNGWKNPFTVYAHIKSGEYEYYAVWEDSITEDEYDRARALEIHGNVCRGSDLEQVLAAQPPRNGYHGETSVVKLPWDDSPTEDTALVRLTVFRSVKEESLFREFIRDAIQRGVKAYGGNEPFRSQVCKSKVEADISQAGYVIVLQELKAYCSKVPQ